MIENHQFNRQFNSGVNAPLNIRGFTLLELLVVLAIVGIMVGTVLFLAAPSATEEGRRLGSKTFELMQKGRVSSMLKRRVYGIEILEDNSAVRLVTLIEERLDVANSTSTDFEDDAAFDDINDFVYTTDDSLNNVDINTHGKEGKEEAPKPTYAMHKMTAEGLGLLAGEAISYWEQEDEKDTIEIPVNINIGFAGEKDEAAPVVDSGGDLDDEDVLEEESISPVIVFFPDGRISNRGSFRFVDSNGDVLYSFTWTELGEFEKVN